jgi:hypothetical protein
MTDDPVDLDEHRGMVAQTATEVRRQRHCQTEILAIFQSPNSCG